MSFIDLWIFILIFILIFMGISAVISLNIVSVELKRIRKVLEWKADVKEDDKNEFDVVIESFGLDKKKSLKAMKRISKKDFSRSTVPFYLMEGISRQEAFRIKEELGNIGVKTSLRGYLL